MKVNIILAVFVVFGEAQNFSQDKKKNSGLQKAFSDIAEFLTERRKIFTIFNFKTSSESSDAAPFAATATIPHIVVKIPHKFNEFELQTSALLSIDSVASLPIFMKFAFLSPVFSVSSDQLIVHLRHGTVEDLKSLQKVFNASFIYFLIEEKSSF